MFSDLNFLEKDTVFFQKWVAQIIVDACVLEYLVNGFSFENRKS